MEKANPHESRELAELELRERVLYALLLPAVRLARVFELPMRSARDLLQMAYFHELKRAGFRMQTISSLLTVSMRKVALLSKRLKDNFALTQAVELPRRIEFMLWAEALSRARIVQALPNEDPSSIDAALSLLSTQGRVALRRSGRKEVYERVAPHARLVTSEPFVRLDALDNFLGNVCEVVFCRFFAPTEPAFVRTVSFRVCEADLDRVRTLYETSIWPLIQELEASASAAPDALSVDLSLCWAPHERLYPQPSASTTTAKR